MCDLNACIVSLSDGMLYSDVNVFLETNLFNLFSIRLRLLSILEVELALLRKLPTSINGGILNRCASW